MSSSASINSGVQHTTVRILEMHMSEIGDRKEAVCCSESYERLSLTARWSGMSFC